MIGELKIDSSGVKNLLNGTLIKGGMWLTVYTVISQIITFASSSVFLRMLSVSDNGVISNYTKIVGVFTTILTLGLTACIQRGKIEYEDNYEGFLSAIFTLATFVIVMFAVVFYIFKYQISLATKVDERLIMLMVAHCFFLFVFQCSSIKYITKYEYRKYFWVNVSYNILVIVLSIIFIVLFENIPIKIETIGMAVRSGIPSSTGSYGRIYGMAIAPILYGVVFYVNQLRRGRTYINREWWKFGLMISLPLIVHSLSSSVMSSFDSLAIRQILGSVEAGLYDVPYKLGMLIYTFWAAINKAWVPWFFEKMKNKCYKEIDRAMESYFIMFTYVFFGFIMVSPELGYLQAGIQYVDSFAIIPIIGLSYYFLFLYGLPVNIEFYEKKTIFITIGTVISALLNVILNIWLIPICGYKIAAVTTLLSYGIQFIYHLIVVKVKFNYEFIKVKTFIIYIAISLGATMYFYVVQDNIIMRYASVLFVTLVIGIKFKNKLIGI